MSYFIKSNDNILNVFNVQNISYDDLSMIFHMKNGEEIKEIYSSTTDVLNRFAEVKALLLSSGGNSKALLEKIKELELTVTTQQQEIENTNNLLDSINGEVI